MVETVFCQSCRGTGVTPTPRKQVIKGKTETVIVDEDCKFCGGSGRQVLDEKPPRDGRYR